MNKEVVYVIQGFLLTVAVLGAMTIGQYLANIPDRSTVQQTAVIDDYQPPTSPSTNSPGAALFKNNCARCHSVTKNLAGPALMGVTERLDRETIHKWVHNPAAMLKSGNPYFVNLQKEYGGVVMTAFPDLSKEEIDNILEYVSMYDNGQKSY